MKSRCNIPRRCKGAALVIVLACLIFASVLTLAFMASMRAKVQTSKSGSDNTEVRLLAETAVNIVVSQIREATLKAGSTGAAWASQPGMIRLYSNDGTPSAYYRLYSWDDMVASSAFSPFSAPNVIPSAWYNNPGQFTDLNAPNNGVYPILNPAAIDPSPGLSGTGGSSVAVDEFTVTNAPATASNTVPMPVKWIYVLSDGSLHLPAASSSGERVIISAASADNPIIGRIAFWADDETCKINVNTASIGLVSTNVGASYPYAAQDYNTFWDTPRFSSRDEYSFANQQPAQGEYQRYPGHPATVALNAVFPAVTTNQIENIFKIAPRYASGGSKGGTVELANQASWMDPTGFVDRLYSTVDEVIFQPPAANQDRRPNDGLIKEQVQSASFFLTTSSRAPELNLSGQPRVSMWPVDVSVTSSGSVKVSAIDRLLAFCATVGSKPFYFTRQDATSTTVDINIPRNQTLLKYLDAMTSHPVPGYGGTFKTKYTEPETRQILTEMFDSIRTTNLEDALLMTSSSSIDIADANTYAHVPTANFGRGQVAPSQNTQWETQGFGSFWRPFEIGLHFVGLGDGPLTKDGPSQPGIPIVDAQRYPRASSSAHSVDYDSFISKRRIHPAPSANTNEGWMPPDNSRAIQGFLMMSFVNLSQARIDTSPRAWLRVSGLDSLQVVGPDGAAHSLGFPSTATMLIGSNTAGDAIGQGFWAGYMPFTTLLSAGGYQRSLDRTDVYGGFPFYSKIVSIPAGYANNTMSFVGGTITIEIFDISAGPTKTANPTTLPTGANLVQTLKVTFPNAPSMPIPGITMFPLNGTLRSPVAPLSIDEYGRYDNSDRWYLPRDSGNTTYGTNFDWSYGRVLVDIKGVADMAGRADTDVVQSMVLSSNWSDARLLAASNIPAAAFTPHPNYGTKRLANDFRLGDLKPTLFNGDVYGKLVEGAVYNTYPFSTTVSLDRFHRRPLTSPSIAAAPATADWDNGIGNYPDGPWVNKSDEGSIIPTLSRSPYFHGEKVEVPSRTFFSPNRQVSSPGVFGSLSTGVKRQIPWQTLLFRPGPAGHPGAANPGDPLLMDLFWMPIVEPYAISEPFSTAGKINLNQQIVPFTYINRYSGLRAAMMGEKVTKVSKAQAATYKVGPVETPSLSVPTRLPLNLSASDGTLRQLVDKFATGEIYRSATDVCSLYLVPQGYTWPAFKSQWYGDDFSMVGDNMREKPYANLYSKLTTKSNTYTVHYRVQAIRQTTANLKSDPTVFDPGKNDKILAEQRGSAVVERYLDPSDARFSSGTPAAFFSDPGNFTPEQFNLEAYYRTRVYNSKIFNP